MWSRALLYTRNQGEHIRQPISRLLHNSISRDSNPMYYRQGHLPEPPLLLRLGLQGLVVLDLPQGLHAGPRLRRLHVLPNGYQSEHVKRTVLRDHLLTMLAPAPISCPAKLISKWACYEIVYKRGSCLRQFMSCPMDINVGKLNGQCYEIVLKRGPRLRPFHFLPNGYTV